MVSKRARFALWWRRSGMGLRAAVFLLGSVLLGLLVYWLNPPEQSDYLGANLLIFGLVNFNIVILGILIFLVGRNVVKLVLDRKRSILGSRLRMRLVLAFVALTLVPTVILFVMASGLLNRVMEGWFSTQVETAVGGSVEVARQHYHTLSDGLRRVSQGIAREIKEKPLIYSQAAAVQGLLEQRRKQQRLFSISLVDSSQRVAARAQHAAAVIETFQEPELDAGALQRALAGESVLLYESQDASQFARFYQAVAFQGDPAVLVTALRFNPKLSQALTKVNDSFKEYESLKLFRIPLRSGYILTLAMITSLILFSAIWVGFYMAREIAVPIQRLAEGTERVARGDYDFQIRAAGDDEITLLVRSFNKMTTDLKLSRREAERRRVYLETVLANLAVAVVALDVGDFVTSVNAAAARLFGKPDAEAVVGLGLQEALGQRVYEQIEAVLAQIKSARIQSPQDLGGPMEQELSIDAGGGVRKIICTAGSIVDAKDNLLGTVLLFDDVTDLAKAQQMAAWREVARRIAHEIKNPLTPIQLSAQRLERLGLARGEEQIVESSKTIVEQVASIKRLADEFSKFARMPAVELEPANLNFLIAELLSPFAETHPQITFQFIADNGLPQVFLDREQMRRALINLLDNAINATRRGTGAETGAAAARISVKSSFHKESDRVSVEVSDNGPGIPLEHRHRIFEPYFTTKKGGTGLGLAIVTSIVSDHQGDIRIFDNQPHGVRFVIDLPIKPGSSTQRKFAAV